MTRLKCLQFALGTLAAALAMCGWHARAATNAFPGPTRRNAKLWITSREHVRRSGYPFVLEVHLHNRGKKLIYIPGGVGPLQFFNVQVKYLRRRGRVPQLRAGVLGHEMNVHAYWAVGVPPGGSTRFWRAVEISRYFDMSIPGRYAIRFAIGHLESNWLKAIIRPPVFRLPVGEILQRSPTLLIPLGGKVKDSMQVRLLSVAQAEKAQPEAVWVYILGDRSQREKLALTGNRLLGFNAIQVEGPDGYNGDELVSKPKPHYIPIPNHEQVPLTAYGKWLVKHPPKKLPEKTYDLKPGVVYKYAVPINLSCQYDMSLRGKYHVRIELAHPKIWSNWVTVKVPS